MLIVSWNINGLRNRFDEVKELIERFHPDFLCLQKVRCDDGRTQYEIEGYKMLSQPVDSGKWSGVVMYYRKSEGPSQISLPERIDTAWLSNEGHLQVYHFRNFVLVNAYVPFSNDKISGAVEYRQQWNIRFRKFIKDLSGDVPVIICGDLNVVHTVYDTCENYLEMSRPCFYKWERDDFKSLLIESGLVDVFRKLHPESVIPTFYGNFRDTGLGNRIDYVLVSQSLLSKVRDSEILSNFGSGQSVPITLDLSFDDDSVRNNPERDNENSNMISVRDVARWLARIAACDGVVSPSEHKLLREFSEAYGIEPGSLFRMAHAIAGKINIPEVEFVKHAEMKGKMFEEFVVRLTADKNRFTRLNWSSDKCVDGIYSLDTLTPDLYLRHKLDKEVVEYYVECKYRSSLPDGILDLHAQLGRYRRMISAEGRAELFVALGLGGSPSSPERFYIIPSRMIGKDHLVRIEYFAKCICLPTADAFHAYINHYFTERIFRRSHK